MAQIPLNKYWLWSLMAVVLRCTFWFWAAHKFVNPCAFGICNQNSAGELICSMITLNLSSSFLIAWQSVVFFGAKTERTNEWRKKENVDSWTGVYVATAQSPITNASDTWIGRRKKTSQCSLTFEHGLCDVLLNIWFSIFNDFAWNTDEK